MPSSSMKRHHNLPAPRVRLIGREQDLLVVRHALLGAEGRLLTLTGAGGCGKTRLALELASDVLPRFPDGVWLVELAAVADPVLVPQAIASALSVREQPGESLNATLRRSLSRRELLLVLDNCEHVIEVCAQVAEELLDGCARLRLLTTSREALRISGELTWRVPSLMLPDQRAETDDVLRSPAVQLFVERARAAVPDFAITPIAASTIGRICRRLDGLPLAIELAAARVSTLGVEQIHDRLDDSVQLLVGGSRTAPTRQQTLRATLDWSHGLLSDQERTLFRRLAVFAEGFDLDAAEAVCTGRNVARGGALDVIDRLIHKSLVVMNTEQDGSARYRLLEPVGQYAQECLTASGERDAIRRRHALHYLALCEARSADTNVGGPHRFSATSELAREYPNIRLVLAYLVENGESQLGLRLAFNLLFLWQVHGALSEPRAWLTRLLALPGADDPTEARAGGLVTAARFAEMAGDTAAAQSFCAEALPLARRVGVPLLEFLALLFSTNNARAVGEMPAAERCARAALACACAAGDPIGEGGMWMTLAAIACDRADYAAAQPLLHEARRLTRANGDPLIEVWTLITAGRAALGVGALDEARAALDAALAMVQQQRQPALLAGFILDALGEVEIDSGRPQQARVWLASSLETRYEGGEILWMAMTFERLAALAARNGQAERALRLAGAGDRLYAKFGARRAPVEQQNLQRWLTPLRETLGQQIADDLWAEGAALALEQAIAMGLDDGGSTTPGAGLTPLGVNAASVLTARELQVAALLRNGLTNRQIAEKLVITERTVAWHVERILEKLGFASRHQVGAWVVEQRLPG